MLVLLSPLRADFLPSLSPFSQTGIDSLLATGQYPHPGPLSSQTAQIQSYSFVDRIPVLLLGRGITALGVLRELVPWGVDTYGISPKSDFASRSRWYQPLPDRVGETAAPTTESLERLLDESKLESAVIMPCSDHWVSAASGISEACRKRFFTSLPSREAAERLQDKGTFAELLRSLSVHHPETRFLERADELRGLRYGESHEWFLKPRDSQKFFGVFGKKAFRVGSEADAIQRFETIREAGLEVILQEYIPGGFDAHYFIDGFRDRHGKISALFARRRMRIYPPDFGNSTAMVTVPLSEVAPAAEGLAKILAETGYRGIFSAEFKQDARDGHFKILEINTRPWWFVNFASRCGVSVCRMAYLDALDQPVPEVKEYPVGELCIHPYYDWHAALPLIHEGRLSWTKWISEFLKAQQPIFSWSDPVPAMIVSWHISCEYVKKRLSPAADQPHV